MESHKWNLGLIRKRPIQLQNLDLDQIRIKTGNQVLNQKQERIKRQEVYHIQIVQRKVAVIQSLNQRVEADQGAAS